MPGDHRQGAGFERVIQRLPDLLADGGLHVPGRRICYDFPPLSSKGIKRKTARAAIWIEAGIHHFINVVAVKEVMEPISAHRDPLGEPEKFAVLPLGQQRHAPGHQVGEKPFLELRA